MSFAPPALELDAIVAVDNLNDAATVDCHMHAILFIVT